MPLFTVENARENAAKGNKVRWSRPKIAAKTQQIAGETPRIAGEITDTFAAQRLQRVREQLTEIDDMISRETVPKNLNWLAAASARLSELERQLAGRPLPGTLRPRQERLPTKRGSLQPINETPQQVVSSGIEQVSSEAITPQGDVTS